MKKGYRLIRRKYLDTLFTLPLGSTALVAAHTSTIYRIMDYGMKRECKGLGVIQNTFQNEERRFVKARVFQHLAGIIR